MKRTAWWKWEWDSHEMGGGLITIDYLKRWRRGWITLYKVVTFIGDEETIEWRLYLPFNLYVGFEYDRDAKRRT